MQVHCTMKTKMKLEGGQNQSALLITKWFRTVLRRVKDAKVTSEEQPKQDHVPFLESEDEQLVNEYEVRIYHYRIIVVFTFKSFILIRLTLHDSLTRYRRRPCDCRDTPGSI